MAPRRERRLASRPEQRAASRRGLATSSFLAHAAINSETDNRTMAVLIVLMILPFIVISFAGADPRKWKSDRVISFIYSTAFEISCGASTVATRR